MGLRCWTRIPSAPLVEVSGVPPADHAEIVATESAEESDNFMITKEWAFVEQATVRFFVVESRGQG